MRIALCTIGSTGDIQPFLALAQVLIARKHEVRACANGFYQNRFEAIGADFRAVGRNTTWDRVRAPLQRIIATQNPMTQFTILAQEMFQNPQSSYEDYTKALKGTDVAAIHLLDSMASVAAREAGIPWAQVRFESGSIATGSQLALHNGSWGKMLNRLSWQVGDLYWKQQEHRHFGEWMKQHPAAPRPRLMRGLSPHLNLLAASKALAPMYPDFPENLVQTGAWFLEEPDYTPPSRLTTFLETHPRPLLATFGSMGAEDGQPVAEILVTAARIAEVPLILQRGFSRFEVADAPDLLVCDYVPHAWIFSRVGAVVHHGGAGTAMAVCRQGTPSIVVPHLLDQFGWARLLHRKGLAPPPIPRTRLRVHSLAKAIKEVFRNPAYQRQAHGAASIIRNEPGAALAADLLEALAR